MSSERERHPEQTSTERASNLDAVGFTAEDILRVGRRTGSRRRRIGVIAVAGSVVALMAVGASVAGLNHRGPARVTSGLTGAPSPVEPTPAATASPLPGDQASLMPTTGVPAASVKLNYAIGSTITPWDGDKITVAVPAGYRISEGMRVPGGWVLTVYPGDETPHVWWQPDAGQARDLGPDFGNWEVSGDGATLVVADAEVTAYRLPTLTKIASTPFADGMGPLVSGVAGDWVILKGAAGDGSATTAASWNLKSGKVTRTNKPVNIWGVSNDGRVLRRVDGPNSSCVDLVAVTALADLGRTGLCSAEITGQGIAGWLSPDGTQVVLTRYGRPTVVQRTSDLHAGVWRPTTETANAGVLGWDTGTTYLVRTDRDELLRCTSAKACTPVALPGLPPDVAIIPNRGF